MMKIVQKIHSKDQVPIAHAVDKAYDRNQICAEL